MEDDDDFEMRVWNDIKTKSYKSKKCFSKGSSNCKLRPKEKAIHHLQHLYSQMYNFNENSTRIREELFNENLLVAQPSNSDSLVIRNSANSVHYSMNKKKRWLLLDILKQKCDEFVFEPNENRTLVKTHIFPKTMQHVTRVKCRYFDNNKKSFDKMVNFDTVQNINRAPRAKRSNRGDGNSNKKKRTHIYKRGNLVKVINSHQNSQEQANIEANRVENELLEAPTIQFDFFVSTVQHDHVQRRGYEMKNYLGDFSNSTKRLRDRYERYYGVPSFTRIKMRGKNRFLKMIKTDIKDLDEIESFNSSNVDDQIYSKFLLDFNTKTNKPQALSEYFNKKMMVFPNMQIRKSKPIEKTEEVSNHFLFYEKQECFQKKIENIELKLNETLQTIEAQSQNEHFLKISFKICSDMKAYLNSFRDAFRLEHVQYSLCFDSTPIKLIIKLDDLIQSRLKLNKQPNIDWKTLLIFDFVKGVHISNYFYLNTVICVNLENIRHFENSPVESLQELIERIVKILVEAQQLKHQQMSTQQSNKPNKAKLSSSLLLLGKLSSIEPNELIKQYEYKLNMNIDSVYREECESLFDKYLQEVSSSSVFEDKKSTYTKTCQICYDQVIWPSGFFKLNKCAHDEEACLNCWLEYVRIRVMNMKVTANAEQINCLFDSCDQTVRLDLLYALVPIDLVDKYIRFYADLRVIRHKDQMTFCKNKNCNRIIISSVDVDLISVCTCGFMLCNMCLQEAHFPAMCFQAKKYLDDRKKLNQIQISNLDELATSEGKNCPNCGNYLEKNMGCNHMSCVCGFEFCWLCLKDFKLFHSSMNGYFCSYKPVEVKKYDSTTFIHLNTNLNNMKTEIYNILNEQAIINQNSNQFKIENIFDEFKSKLTNDFHRFNLKAIQAKFDPKQQEKYVKMLRDLDEIKRKLDDFKDILHKLNQLIEYLALLCSASKVYFNKNGFSYKTNFIKCLRKAVLLRASIMKLISEEQTTCNYLKLNNFYVESIKFIKNLKHFVTNSAKIYAK